VCSDECITWLDTRYPGVHRGQNHYDHWTFYTAKGLYSSDVLRQQALRCMLVSAVNPPSAPRDWRTQLRMHNWCTQQMRRWRLPPRLHNCCVRFAIFGEVCSEFCWCIYICNGLAARMHTALYTCTGCCTDKVQQ
jgi:hypothetical protein